jgi:hypothetical protein
LAEVQAAEGRRRALRLPLDATDAQCEAGEHRRRALSPAECRMAELRRWRLQLAEDATDVQCDLVEACQKLDQVNPVEAATPEPEPKSESEPVRMVPAREGRP